MTFPFPSNYLNTSQPVGLPPVRGARAGLAGTDLERHVPRAEVRQAREGIWASRGGGPRRPARTRRLEGLSSRDPGCAVYLDSQRFRRSRTGSPWIGSTVR